MKSKVLVTGAGGFIGSHLCDYLVRAGAEVRALVRYNSSNSWGHLEQSEHLKEMDIQVGDLRDYDSVRNVMKDVSTVYHLGALIGIPYSYQSPLAYVKTNVEGTYNVLENARQLGTEKVLITSTSEVYGTALYTPIDEKHPLQPQSPYSASKIGADNLALSYFNSFETPVTVVRPFNTYGPRQSARAIIPTLISQLLAKVPEIRVGNMNPVRDLTFVEDTVSGMVEIGQVASFRGQAINIGTGEAVTIRQLYERICAIVGYTAPVREEAARIRPGKSEVMTLVSDNRLLRSHSTWQPKYSLDEGLKRTVSWIDKNLSRYKPTFYTV